MSESYDVVVIGAGLGGLSAATMLANGGRKVLLLERHNVPGGCATSFVRGRYEFEVALHELSGIGPPERRGALFRYLEHLGVTDKVGFAVAENLYRSVFPDLDLTLPRGEEAFEATLCEAFPKEADGIRRFLGRVYDLGRDFGQIIKQRGPGSPWTMPYRLPHFFRYLPVTWGEVLHRDVKDPAARAVLSQYWGYVGMGPSSISFLFFAITLAAYVKRGGAFPKGRSQALTSALLSRLEELGGTCRLGCGARRILTQGDRVTGVITDRDEEISTRWVVSNADPIATCQDLIGIDRVPAGFLRELGSSEVAPSTVNVYMGVDREPAALGLTEHEVFVNADYDLDRHAEGIWKLEPPESMAVTCYNSVYPDISPPGTSMVVLTGLSYGKLWYDVPPAEYVATKNRIADGMIEQAEAVAPGLREHTEVVEVSTPLTNMRYMRALGGSIYGFNQPPRDNMVWRMRQRGPLGGLYFVGAWTQPGGGFEPTMLSGQMVGAAILKGGEQTREGS